MPGSSKNETIKVYAVRIGAESVREQKKTNKKLEKCFP